MSTAHEQRFANQIEWIPFFNKTGKVIPPYSCICLNVPNDGWRFPDFSDDINVNQPPAINAYQLTSWTINPDDYYLTGGAPTPSDGSVTGICQRPVGRPMLASISSFTQIAVGAIVGPTPSNFNLSVGAPGFRVVATASNGYAPVVVQRGPYAAQLPANTGSTLGSVQVTLLDSSGQPGSTKITVQNPWANINTTVSGANRNCLIDWVAGLNQWQVTVAVPTCPNASSDS